MTLNNDIRRANPDFSFEVVPVAQALVNELAAIAEKLNYDPNPNDYHNSLALRLTSKDTVSKIVVSFHSVGSAFRGLVVAVGYFQTGDSPPIPVCDDIFRINYLEPRNDIIVRYAPWLDDCLIRGLAEWRRTLA